MFIGKKSDFLNIMKNFVDLKINGKQFVSQLNKLHRSNQEVVKLLKTDLKQLNTFEQFCYFFNFLFHFWKSCASCETASENLSRFIIIY